MIAHVELLLFLAFTSAIGLDLVRRTLRLESGLDRVADLIQRPSNRLETTREPFGLVDEGPLLDGTDARSRNLLTAVQTRERAGTDLLRPLRQKANTIFEAKGSVAGSAFRLAVGQLADYSRLIDPAPKKGDSRPAEATQ